jgi:hypothetical protein
VPVFTGDVTVDRADNGLITGMAAYAGAVAGVELGRSCCDVAGASGAPKGWGTDLDAEGAVDARRSMRFGLAFPVTGAVAGGEDGAAWKSAKSSSPPAKRMYMRYQKLTMRV